MRKRIKNNFKLPLGVQKIKIMVRNMFHTSKNLFFEFDFSLSKEGDLNWDFEKEEIILGAFFSDNPIPYYPNKFTYLCEVQITEYDAIVNYDKFSNNSKIGEAHIRSADRIKIIEIAEIPELCQDLYYKKYREEYEFHCKNNTTMTSDWLSLFKLYFNKYKIIL